MELKREDDGEQTQTAPSPQKLLRTVEEVSGKDRVADAVGRLPEGAQ